MGLWIFFPPYELNKGNKTALLPDALDAVDAFHQRQGLVERSLRRPRQLRRVDLQFVTPPLPLYRSSSTLYLPENLYGI